MNDETNKATNDANKNQPAGFYTSNAPFTFTIFSR